MIFYSVRKSLPHTGQIWAWKSAGEEGAEGVCARDGGSRWSSTDRRPILPLCSIPLPLPRTRGQGQLEVKDRMLGVCLPDVVPADVTS